MSVQNFIPEIWHARLLMPFEKALVYASLANRDYEGDIKLYGDTVRINGIGPISVSDYTTSVSYQSLEAEQQTLTIDQKKYWGFKVDDIDRRQSQPAFIDKAMNKAAYAMADAVDQYIAGLYTSASATTAVTPVNSLNVLALLLSLSQTLTEQNIPRDNRWAVIPPWFTNKLVIAKVLVENTTNTAFENGFVGRAAGFNLYESNNVPTTNLGTEYKIMAGYGTEAISFAGQITETEALRDVTDFDDYMRGLYVFGAKVVQPDALVVGDVSVLAEV